MTTPVEPSQRVAIVTGAADGIGWATAQRLASDFSHVVVADLRPDAAKARAVELGGGHWWFGCDVMAEAQVCALVREVVARFGRLDALVNNAGIGEQPVMTLEQTVDAFDRILSVHLRGTFIASREANTCMIGTTASIGLLANGTLIPLGRPVVPDEYIIMWPPTSSVIAVCGDWLAS